MVVAGLDEIAHDVGQPEVHIDCQGCRSVSLGQPVLSDTDFQERGTSAAHVRRNGHRGVTRRPKGFHVFEGIGIFFIMLRRPLGEVVSVARRQVIPFALGIGELFHGGSLLQMRSGSQHDHTLPLDKSLGKGTGILTAGRIGVQLMSYVTQKRGLPASVTSRFPLVRTTKPRSDKQAVTARPKDPPR